jgi:hypothetical protein
MAHDIQHANPLPPPADILARLRETDRNAHLFYLESGVWALGRVVRDWQREQTARRMLVGELAAENPRPDVVQLYRLYAQGFRITRLYTSAEVYSGMVVRDWRERCWNARNNREETMKARQAESERMFDPEEKTKQMMSMLDQEARSMHSILFRHRKSFHYHN